MSAEEWARLGPPSRQLEPPGWESIPLTTEEMGLLMAAVAGLLAEMTKRDAAQDEIDAVNVLLGKVIAAAINTKELNRRG